MQKFILGEHYWFLNRECKLVWIDTPNGGPGPVELTFRVIRRWSPFPAPAIEYKMSIDRAAIECTPVTKKRL